MNNVAQKQKKIYFGLDISQKTIEIFALKGEKDVSFGKMLVSYSRNKRRGERPFAGLYHVAVA